MREKKTWQWLLGTVVTLITSITAVLLAFPSLVERSLNVVLDKVSAISFDKELRRKVVIDELIAFDTKHHSHTAIVEVMPDFGLKIIWLNPEANQFWKKKQLAEGQIEYPRFAALEDLRRDICRGYDDSGEMVLACSLLGKTHFVVSYPQDSANKEQFKLNLSLLSGRIDRYFIGK